MCGRFTLHHTADEIAERFAVEAEEQLEPRYNIAPTQPVAVVLQNGSRHLEYQRWGLVPSWAKDISIGSRMINARAETLAEKPSFRTALARRRCLIPADGFYEWREADNPEEGGRTPMHIRRTDKSLFAFAGLWDEWHAPDGSSLRTCTIITGAPNSLMLSIHDRMPIILPQEHEEIWLDSSLHDTQTLSALLRPYPAEAIEAFAVGRQVNSPMVDMPENIAPLSA